MPITVTTHRVPNVTFSTSSGQKCDANSCNECFACVRRNGISNLEMFGGMRCYWVRIQQPVAPHELQDQPNSSICIEEVSKNSPKMGGGGGEYRYPETEPDPNPVLASSATSRRPF